MRQILATIWIIGYFLFGLLFLVLEVGLVGEFVNPILAIILVVTLSIPFTIFLPLLYYLAYGSFVGAFFIIGVWAVFILYSLVGYFILND